MRYQSGHKAESKKRLLKAAGRAFRKQGFSGIGVDGLAKGADLTSGAFYIHFSSKMEAFLETVEAGLEDLRAGIDEIRTKYGKNWLSVFGSFYLSEKRTCDLQDGCALPSLSAEVERAGSEARALYESKLREVAEAVAAGLPEGAAKKRDQAWAVLALLSGGVMMARTVQDQALAEEISAAIEAAVRSFGASGNEP